MATSAVTEADDVSTISGATLEKACRELGEVPASRAAVIEELRGRIAQWEESHAEEGLALPRREAVFLLRFLRARKFDVERALTLFINYHRYRQKHAPMLSDFHPRSVEHVLRSGLISVLNDRSQDGCKVLVLQAARWDMDDLPMSQVLKALLLILDKLIEDQETQVHGFILFENLDGVGLLQMLRLARLEQEQQGETMELIQDAFPGRFKGVHLLNQPWYVSILLSLVRPFLKQKLRERIHMHGSDFSGLYEFMDPSHLPAEFGGLLPSIDAYSAAHLFEHELQDEEHDP